MRKPKSILIGNEFLQITLLPEVGGKIASIRSVVSGEEFLLPSLREYGVVSAGAQFSEGDCGGFDECLPSVAACDGVGDEGAVPDHGDLWRVAWEVDSADDEMVEMHVDARSRPLRLTRVARLQGASLRLEYTLKNLSDVAASWLWSAHPLLKVDAGDRIVLPKGIDAVEVEYAAGSLLKRGEVASWPVAQSSAGETLDLSVVGERDGIRAHKLFARMARTDESGYGGVYRTKARQGIVVRFDPAVLPYLGMWICLGAWPDEGAQKQYTVALEPTTSPVDSLEVAMAGNDARSLGGGESCRWWMEIEVIGAEKPVSFERFVGLAEVSRYLMSGGAHSRQPDV